MNIAIIGGGNMGEAFAKGIHEKFLHNERDQFAETSLRTGAHDNDKLSICERNLDRHAIFSALKITVSQTHEEIAKNADIIILAVKPNDIQQTCESISQLIKSDALIFSIAAGITIDSLEKWLKGDKNTAPKIVRIMPNLLASIGKSVSVWYAPNLSNTEKELTQAILESLGTAYELASEEVVDQATAISGCGPAYLWYFMDAIVAAGEKIGLPHKLAHDLSAQTILGAAIFAGETHKHDFDPKVMCQKVASKGGSTEKALAVFEERNFKKIIETAVEAAYNRAREMGKR